MREHHAHVMNPEYDDIQEIYIKKEADAVIARYETMLRESTITISTKEVRIDKQAEQIAELKKENMNLAVGILNEGDWYEFSEGCRNDYYYCNYCDNSSTVDQHSITHEENCVYLLAKKITSTEDQGE